MLWHAYTLNTTTIAGSRPSYDKSSETENTSYKLRCFRQSSVYGSILGGDFFLTCSAALFRRLAGAHRRLGFCFGG